MRIVLLTVGLIQTIVFFGSPPALAAELSISRLNMVWAVTDSLWLDANCAPYRADQAAIDAALQSEGFALADFAEGGWAAQHGLDHANALNRAAQKHGLEVMCTEVAERFGPGGNRPPLVVPK